MKKILFILAISLAPAISYSQDITPFNCAGNWVQFKRLNLNDETVVEGQDWHYSVDTNIHFMSGSSGSGIDYKIIKKICIDNDCTTYNPYVVHAPVPYGTDEKWTSNLNSNKKVSKGTHTASFTYNVNNIQNCQAVSYATLTVV